jgi:hypothetical protein
MIDLMFVLLTIALFALAAGYVRLCRDGEPETAHESR